jgi:hypothetical protein
MNEWKDTQLAELDKAVEEYFKILKSAKRTTLTDQDVKQNIIEFMAEHYDVKVSVGWIAGILYKGALSIQGASWITVQGFIAAMHDPRLAGHALRERRPLYI